MYSTLYSVLKFLDEIASRYDNEKERSLMFTKSMLGKHCGKNIVVVYSLQLKSVKCFALDVDKLTVSFPHLGSSTSKSCLILRLELGWHF